MMSCFPGQRPGLVWIDGDADFESLFRKELLDVFRPLHDAEAAAVKVIIEADFNRFGQSVDPVEIEMVHRLAVTAHVFIDDGESRRADRIGHSQHLADCRGEGCLSGTHRGKECHQRAVADLFKKFRRCSFEVLDPVYDYFVFHAAKELQITLQSIVFQLFVIRRFLSCSFFADF